MAREAPSSVTEPVSGRSHGESMRAGVRTQRRSRATLLNNLLLAPIAAALLASDQTIISTHVVYSAVIVLLARFALAWLGPETAILDLVLPVIEMSKTRSGVRASRAIVSFLVVGLGAGVLSAALAKALGLAEPAFTPPGGRGEASHAGLPEPSTETRTRSGGDYSALSRLAASVSSAQVSRSSRVQGTASSPSLTRTSSGKW